MTWNIEGKRVLVTGGTTGIGRATVAELAARGAEVVFTARSPAAGDEVVADVTAASPGSVISHRRLDLDDLAAVRSFAEQFSTDFDRLDVLINNAGVVLTERRLTADGHEFTFGVNHLGHFQLVQSLLPLLEASAPARIVIVASDAHQFTKGLDFDDLMAASGRFGAARGMAVYSRSKLANMLHTHELAKRLPADQVTVNCVHPGAVRTRLGRDTEASRLSNIVWPAVSRFFLTPEKGARTSVWAATAPELDGVTGEYFVKSRIKKPRKTARDDAAAARLWTVSEDLLAASTGV
ncbi:MAG: retinol dehydrogenase [Acidimicrobiales bacterium]|nr:MAG: retinol dehydrogenase [Acidimicrobiales bacterium]